MRKDRDVKEALARLAGRVCDGRIARHDFLHQCGRLGLGFSAAALTSMVAPRPIPRIVAPASAQTATSDRLQSWLREVGGGFRGATIRMATETTAPSVIIKRLAAVEFTPLTGIDVDIELLPLERVLRRTSLDVVGQTSRYDIHYLDRSWTALFADDMVDTRELYDSNKELALPGCDRDDFLPTLIEHMATYDGKLVGIPFDIPIFIMFYRQDLFDELALKVPTTLDEYSTVIQAIQADKSPLIYGTTGQMKAGHYSLNCEWTAWLWANGGSIFNADGYFSGGDAEGLEGLDYMLRLYENMPPYVDTWTWDGQAQSLLQGLAGVALTWAEIFPATDDPQQSLVAGLMGAAPPPRANALRPRSECGFGEIPNIGHQGGSTLGLSRNSQSQEAAWIFLRWGTSAEIQTRASVMGGGASPTRISVFENEAIAAAANIQAGTTRHFDAVRLTIETAIGSEPDLPVWPELSNGVIPRELGRLLAGDHENPAAAMATVEEAVDAAAAPYRT